MAVTDPSAIRFCDEKIRVVADKLAQADSFALAVINEWTASFGTSVIPNTSVVIADSAAPNGVDTTGGDGRTLITGQMVNNIINRCNELRSALAVTGLAMSVAGVRTTVLQVAVHTTG